MRTLSFLFATTIGLAACATPQSAPPSLADTHWRFLLINGAAPVADKTRLNFQGDRLGANLGCNTLGGNWRMEAGRLIADPLISTQMWCEGRMDQERAFSAMMAEKPLLTIKDNRMSLKSDSHSAELVRTEGN